ncbi:MAG TPA: OmpA family protein [Aliiroseovarius sp.]|nr:OmpA family protein [Aliiroseovarius sp.]
MRRLLLISAGFLAMSAAAPLAASDSGHGLSLPAPASRTFSDTGQAGAHKLAAGPWQDGQLTTQTAKGQLTTETWRLPGKGRATGALAEMLAEQLAGSGYDLLYQCTQDSCGGFDFRFAIDVVSEPQMHVDLGEYSYLLALRPGAPGPQDDAYISLLVSSSPGAGYVQITRVTPASSEEHDTATVTSTMTEPAATLALPDAPIGDQLEQNGYAVLADLEFETGSSELGPGPFASLGTLATYLRENPQRTIALVGHTDAEGSLDVNIVIYKRRATSVRQRLIEEYGLPEAQLSAEGIGFLSPLDSNQTESGRNKNRRVEVILTSTRP